MRSAFTVPTSGVGSRRFAWLLLGLLSLLAATGVTTPLGPAVPLALLVTIVGLAVTSTSSWHGLFAVVATVVLVPVPFSVALGPITVSAGRALLFALVGGWLLQRRAGGPAVPRTPLGPPMFVLIAVMAASTVANTPRMAGFELAGAFRKLGLFGIDYVLLFLVAATVLTDARRLMHLVRFVAGLVVLTAVLGILEFATGRNVFELLTPWLPGGVGRFISELADASVLSRGRITRVRSTLEQPLAFGSLLLLGLPLAIALSVSARERTARLRWAAGGVAIGAAVLLTAGRSIYVIAGLGVVTMLVRLPDDRARRSVLAVTTLVAVLFLVQRDVRDTMFAFFQPRQSGVLEGSIESRVNDYEPVLQRVGERPILGFGPRTFAVDELRVNELLPNPDDLVLDNAYLGALAETGVLGLLALAGVLVTAATAAWRSARRACTEELATVGLALAVAVQSWVLMGFAADVYVFNAPPRVFFVLLAAVCTARRLAVAPSEGAQPSPAAAGRPGGDGSG